MPDSAQGPVFQHIDLQPLKDDRMTHGRSHEYIYNCTHASMLLTLAYGALLMAECRVPTHQTHWRKDLSMQLDCTQQSEW